MTRRMGTYPRSVRLIGRGHGAIRATHGKTLEFGVDSEITARATCVVAVGTEVADAGEGGVGGRVAGPVRITIRAGGESFVLEALGNPAWTPGQPAVVRRSGRRLPGTLATEASAAADDLPRPLLAALQDPAVTVTVDVEPIRGRPAAVLVALDPGAAPDPRLAAELAAADLVVAEDDGAARLLGERVAHGPVAVDRRVLVAATGELPGATVAGQLAQVPVDVLGLPAPLAAAAASPSRRPLVLATGTDPRAAVRETPPDRRLVVAATADEVAGLLRLAGEVRGAGTGVVLARDDRPRRVGLDSELAGGDPVHLCFDAVTESSALDPRVRAAVEGLLADGVATKTAANALAALTGWERRRAYDTVLEWRAT
jgi:hypothetical protein